jgi:hypothetical protein
MIEHIRFEMLINYCHQIISISGAGANPITSQQQWEIRALFFFPYLMFNFLVILHTRTLS